MKRLKLLLVLVLAAGLATGVGLVQVKAQSPFPLEGSTWGVQGPDGTNWIYYSCSLSDQATLVVEDAQRIAKIKVDDGGWQKARIGRTYNANRTISSSGGIRWKLTFITSPRGGMTYQGSESETVECRLEGGCSRTLFAGEWNPARDWVVFRFDVRGASVRIWMEGDKILSMRAGNIYVFSDWRGNKAAGATCLSTSALHLDLARSAWVKVTMYKWQ